jgi:hypothetical protein
MKNLFKLIGVVLAAALLLVTVSCSEEDFIKKGGTIQVTNAAEYPYTVAIYKGSLDMFDEIKDSLKFDPDNIINVGETKSFKKDEDGYYLVTGISMGLDLFKKDVILLGDNTQKVTIKSSTTP